MAGGCVVYLSPADAKVVPPPDMRMLLFSGEPVDGRSMYKRMSILLCKDL